MSKRSTVKAVCRALRARRDKMEMRVCRALRARRDKMEMSKVNHLGVMKSQRFHLI